MNVELSEKEVKNPETDIEEVYIQNDDNLEKLNVELNDEDYYILFKVIQRHIKDNFSNTLLDVFKEKGISINNIDITQIVYDSDENEDSEEEDEYLGNNDFEENYKNMV